MKVKVEIPKGKYCRVWGKIHCIFNEDVCSGDYGICRLKEGLCDKDKEGQSLKRDDCPAYPKEYKS